MQHARCSVQGSGFRAAASTRQAVGGLRLLRKSADLGWQYVLSSSSRSTGAYVSAGCHG